MKLIGRVESLWRYPVKSMREAELQEAFVGSAIALLTTTIPNRRSPRTLNWISLNLKNAEPEMSPEYPARGRLAIARR